MEDIRRTIETNVSETGDGSFRSVARLTDPFHEIEVTVVVRDADYTITEASARMMRVPYADNCPNSMRRIDELTGVQIGPSLSRTVREAVGGDHGCPYLVELSVQACKLAMLASMSAQAREAVIVDDDLDKFDVIHHKMGDCAGHYDLPFGQLPAWLEAERDRARH
jgi:hypothetical protein